MSRPKRLPPLKPETVAALQRAVAEVAGGAVPFPGEVAALCPLKNADPRLAFVVLNVHWLDHWRTRRSPGGRFIRGVLAGGAMTWVRVFRRAAGVALAAGDVGFFQQVAELLAALAPGNGKQRLDAYIWMECLGQGPVKLSDLRDSVNARIQAEAGGSAQGVTSADVRDSLRRLGIPWK